jgi:hypothetical protein
MIKQLARGMNIYYRGYLIHEDIRHIHYTIYGMRPHRVELTNASNSLEAMQWIDRQIATREVESLMVWPTLFPSHPLPAATNPW